MMQDELQQDEKQIAKVGIELVFKGCELTKGRIEKVVDAYLTGKGTGTNKSQTIKERMKSDKNFENYKSADVTKGDMRPFTDYFKKTGISWGILKNEQTNPPTWHLFFKAEKGGKFAVDKSLKSFAKDLKEGKIKDNHKRPIHDKLTKFQEKSKKLAVDREGIRVPKVRIPGPVR